MSKYEKMRTDSANWKLGIAYCCKDDPRIVVRQRLPIGWTWNFGHPGAVLAILLAIVVLLGPPYIAWWLGVRSGIAMLLVVLVSLGLIVLVANHLSRDPGD